MFFFMLQLPATGSVGEPKPPLFFSCSRSRSLVAAPATPVVALVNYWKFNQHFEPNFSILTGDAP